MYRDNIRLHILHSVGLLWRRDRLVAEASTLQHINIININIRHQLDLDRPVSVSSNSLFIDLPSLLRPFGLQLSIIFAILLLFILVTCRQFDLYLLSLSSNGSNFISSKIYSFLLWSKMVYVAVLPKNLILMDASSF